MTLIQILLLAKFFSITLAVKCTGMSSPQNINANEGNFTSPGWRRPLPASDVCEWVINIAGMANNVVVKVNLKINTVSTNKCGNGGRLSMPDGSTECGKKPNRCIVYSYDQVNNAACRKNIAKSSCKLIPLRISKWPLRFQYTQDVNGQSKGFSLSYTALNCESMVFPTPRQETDATTTPSRPQQSSWRPTSTAGTSPEPIAGTTTALTKVLIGLVIVIVLLVIVVLIARYCIQSKTADSETPLQSPSPSPDVAVYGSNGGNHSLYTAAEECEGGYDDSQLRQRPTPAPRTSSNATETEELTSTTEGYDDLKLKSEPKEEFHFYQEVRKKSSGAAVVAQQSEEAHTYEEVRRASSAAPNSRQDVQPPTDEYSYDT